MFPAVVAWDKVSSVKTRGLVAARLVSAEISNPDMEVVVWAWLSSSTLQAPEETPISPKSALATFVASIESPLFHWVVPMMKLFPVVRVSPFDKVKRSFPQVATGSVAPDKLIVHAMVAAVPAPKVRSPSSVASKAKLLLAEISPPPDNPAPAVRVTPV